MNKAEELIACLEGEIAKRDARIGELDKKYGWALSELAAIKAQEPVQVDYVAVMRADGDGGLEVEWLLEGGTAELMNGMYLCCVGGGTLLFEEGSGHLYAAPLSEAKAQGAAKMPCGTAVSNVYEAYDAGMTAAKAQGVVIPEQEWLQDGGLIYALKDGSNHYEINVTQVAGNRSTEARKEFGALLIARLNAAPVQQVSVPETYGLPPLPWSLRKCNHIFEDYPEILGGKPGFKPVYLEPVGLCIGQTHLDWPLADFILACVNSAAPAAPAADVGLVEALEASNMLLRTKRHACENEQICRVLDVHIKRNTAALAAHRAKGVV